MKKFLLFATIISVAWAGPQEVKIKKVPVSPTNATSGPEMFHAYCAACHGATGVGNGPAVAALKVAPADLTSLKANNGGKFPDMRVMEILNGNVELAAHGSSDMPVWGSLFHSLDGGNNKSVTELRIHNITEYLKSIQK